MPSNTQDSPEGSVRTSYYREPSSPDALKAWLNERGISTHPSLRVIEMSDGSGLTVHLDETSEPLGVGTSLCIIPKSSIFSHRTAHLPTHVPPPPEIYTSPAISTLYLTACLLHELRLGEESRWYGWLQILPRDTISLPTFWDNEALSGSEGKLALKWIEGTSAERELDRKDQEGLSLGDLEDFFDEIEDSIPMTSACPPPPSFADFAYAYSLVSTRGFVIDAYHIIALVPFCDLFNHSSSIASTSLLSDTAVCAQCGKLDGCEHEPGSSTHSETQGRDNDVVEMRVERKVMPGQEILSCYEDNAENGKLLVEWGFVDDKSSPDGVSWSPREVLNGSTIRPFVELLSRKALRALSMQCSQVIAPPSEKPPGLLIIYADGRASISLIIALALPYVFETPHDSIEELEADVAAIVAKLERLPDAQNQDSGEEIVRRKVQSLVEHRLLRLHRSQATLAEIEGELKVCSRAVGANSQRLEPSQDAQRQAMTLHIQERTVLEAALRKCTV